MEAQHGAHVAFDLFLVVGVDEEGERRAVGAGGRFDHMRHVLLAAGLIEEFELLAGELGVLLQVKVASVGNPLKLRPADREEVLDVAGAARIVAQLILLVDAKLEVVGADSKIGVPAEPLVAPELEPLVGLGRGYEELHLHLFKLARAEDEVAGRNLVAERLADLGNSERRLLARELQHVLEVDEDALRSLGAQIGGRAGILQRADRRLEHQVELACLRQLAVGAFAGVLRGLIWAVQLVEVIGAEALAAVLAVNHRVAEAADVTARLPDARVLEDRRVESDHVIALRQQRTPPFAFDVGLQQHTVMAEVVGRAEAAVNLRGGEDEAAPLAERDDLVHCHCVFSHCPMLRGRRAAML